jgi:hypothetical protein
VAGVWRDESRHPVERAGTACVYASALVSIPGSDRAEAWAAATYAAGTGGPGPSHVTAFAEVLLASGYRNEASALAREAARLAPDEPWRLRAENVVTACRG